MKIVVTGVSGQLGHDVMLALAESGEHEAIGLSRAELDLADGEQCAAVLARIRPDAIIHCAAYTGVDRAETDAEQAFAVNADGAGRLAAAAEAVGAKMAFVSTDYVFDGTAQTPYDEGAATNPQTVYGKSKRQGELNVLAQCSRSFVVRTSWVFGLNGSNFVKTMLKLGQERDTLKVVADQFGSPTFSHDLARFLVQLVETDRYGIYHASNSGSCSWYEFATAIFVEAGMNVVVEPCTTDEFPRPAPRPRYSVLAHNAIAAGGFADLRHWREALADFINRVSE